MYLRFFILCLLVWMSLWASSPVMAESGIVLTQVSAPKRNNTLHLDASANIRLSDGVQAALDRGVSLIFVTTIQIRRKAKLLPAKRMLSLEITRRLAYHALTKKFTVDDLTFGTRESFSSLARALVYIGKYRGISLLDLPLVNSGPNVFLRMRIRLVRDALPMPLRLKSYVSSDWYLSSDWYEWSLQ